MVPTITIEQKIQGLGGGEYQRLVAAFFAAKLKPIEYGFPGSRAGANKTTTGRPDAQYLTANGDYIFLEAGSVANHRKAVDKIRDDLQDTYDYIDRLKQAGSARKVKNIVLAYTCSMITPDELDDISGEDERVIFLGINELAERLRRYPSLLDEYLDITSDNQQLMDYEGFVSRCKRDNYSPSHELGLIGREKELAELLELSGGGQTILLTGPSGSGKTKLALEAARQMEMQKGIPAWYCTSDGLPYLSDLAEYTDGDRECLLMLDDVNAFGNLEGLVAFLLGHPRAIVLATVRDYELMAVQREFARLPRMKVVKLDRLGDEEFEACLREANAEIGPDLAHELWSITHMNLRLALTCVKNLDLSEFGQRGFGLSDVIEKAYGKLLADLSSAEVKTFKILALFQRGWLSDPSIGRLKEVYGLSNKEFDGAIKSLYDRELIQTEGVQDARAFFVAEQNLRDFLVYLQIVRDEEHRVTLSALADMGVDARCLWRLAVSVYRVFPSRDVRDSIRYQVVTLWKERDESHDELLRHCALLLPEEDIYLTLRNHVKDVIDADTDVGKYVIGALADLLCDVIEQVVSNRRLVEPLIDLLCDFVCDIKSVPSCVVQMLDRSFGYVVGPSAQGVDLGNASLMLDCLMKRVVENPCRPLGELLCRHTSNLLKCEVQGSRCAGEGSVVTLYRGELDYSDDMMELRHRAIDAVSTLPAHAAPRDLGKECLLGVECGVGESDDRHMRLRLETARACFMAYVDKVEPADWDAARLVDLYNFLNRCGEVSKLAAGSRELLDDVGRMIEFGSSVTGDEIDPELREWARVVPAERIARVIDNMMAAMARRACTSTDYVSAEGIARVISVKRASHPNDAEALFTRYLQASGVFEYDFLALIDGLIQKRGWPYVRKLAEDSKTSNTYPNNRRAWLQAIDSEAVRIGEGVLVANRLLASASAEAEALEYDLLKRMDEQMPGFLERYLNALLDAGDLGAYAAVQALSPRDDKRADVLALLGENTELLVKLEKIVSAMVKKRPGDIRVEAIVQVCLDADSSYAALLVKGLCAEKAICSYEEVDLIAGALWESETVRDCVRVAICAAMSLEDEDWFRAHNVVELCKKIAELTPDEEVEEWFLSFLVENACRKDEKAEQGEEHEQHKRREQRLSRSIAGAASELPTMLKLNYLQQLCRKGLKPENLRAAVMDPNGVTSWSGGEGDFIEAKIRFWKTFINQLDIVEFAEMRRAARGIIDQLTAAKDKATAREMAMGW
ncbi:MAG: hypothetical protein UHI81_09395 [Olegusella sp.]|nr:hypothetical protein [Olegusella sp.]